MNWDLALGGMLTACCFCVVMDTTGLETTPYDQLPQPHHHIQASTQTGGLYATHACAGWPDILDHTVPALASPQTKTVSLVTRL